MPGISIHVVDVSRGIVASGMQVELHALGSAPRQIAKARVAASGLLEAAALGEVFSTGEYEAVLDVADYYRDHGITLPAVPFLGRMAYRFGIADSAQHYHLPFKVTPWGCSCFRGGA